MKGVCSSLSANAAVHILCHLMMTNERRWCVQEVAGTANHEYEVYKELMNASLIVTECVLAADTPRSTLCTERAGNLAQWSAALLLSRPHNISQASRAVAR